MTKSTQNWFSRAGARALANTINEYWRERGFEAGAEAYPLSQSTNGKYTNYGVRSELVSGLPVRRIGK